MIMCSCCEKRRGYTPADCGCSDETCIGCLECMEHCECGEERPYLKNGHLRPFRPASGESRIPPSSDS
jgi:hypothetical protein